MSNTYHERRLRAAIEMFKKGNTLNEIGAVFGITRERVRQILKKAGVASYQGGASLRILLKAERDRQEKIAASQKRESWARRTFGCSFDQYEALGHWNDSKSPAGVYYAAVRNAKRRGIGWDFTLPEWWAVWKQSGGWSFRGSPHQKKNKGRFVMSRYGDSGPYSAENVRIVKWEDNVREARFMEKLHRAVE